MGPKSPSISCSIILTKEATRRRQKGNFFGLVTQSTSLPPSQHRPWNESDPVTRRVGSTVEGTPHPHLYPFQTSSRTPGLCFLRSVEDLRFIWSSRKTFLTLPGPTTGTGSGPPRRPSPLPFLDPPSPPHLYDKDKPFPVLFPSMKLGLAREDPCVSEVTVSLRGVGVCGVSRNLTRFTYFFYSKFLETPQVIPSVQSEVFPPQDVPGSHTPCRSFPTGTPEQTVRGRRKDPTGSDQGGSGGGRDRTGPGSSLGRRNPRVVGSPSVVSDCVRPSRPW